MEPNDFDCRCYRLPAHQCAIETAFQELSFRSVLRTKNTIAATKIAENGNRRRQTAQLDAPYPRTFFNFHSDQIGKSYDPKAENTFFLLLKITTLSQLDPQMSQIRFFRA
jgi:hypothetical protein